MASVIIIPARYDSTRFPGKPLALLNGKPMIQHVYENSKKSKLAEGVIVATDNKAISEAVLAFGGKAVMTSVSHISGTDRIAEVAQTLDYDIIVNVQGDEPLIKAEMIDDVISLLDDKKASIGTLIKKIESADDVFDPNIVKVVCDRNGCAMYFSRAPIPFDRDKWRPACSVQRSTPPYPSITNGGHGGMDWYKHIGVYSYRRDVLLSLAKMAPEALEQTEKLEQLRALVNGYKIKVKETKFETFGIDTPKDLERVRQWLNLSS